MTRCHCNRTTRQPTVRQDVDVNAREAASERFPVRIEALILPTQAVNKQVCGSFGSLACCLTGRTFIRQNAGNRENLRRRHAL